MDSVIAFEKRLKRHIIGKPHLFLAIAPLGFEQTLADELTSICQGNVCCHPEPQRGEGSSPESISFLVIGDGKVEFTAKITDAWKAVAYTRVANRILMHIADFKAENFRDLEKKAAEIPWELYLPRHTEALRSKASVSTEQNMDFLAPTGLRNDNHAIHIHVTCKHSRLYHSDAVAERLYNVIAESLHNCHSGAEGDRVQAEDLSQNLYVTLIDDRCTIWLDLAGEELYKRGHERFVNDAPLKETIAAGMILEVSALVAAPITLIDPMAGSGTFSLEAAYMANGLIPGKCRDFALKHQPAFKPATWKHIVSSMNSLAPTGLRNDYKKALVCPIANILTSDISERAVGIIRHNVECSPLAQLLPAINVTPQLRDFFTYTAKEIADACRAVSQPVIVLNPPYGKRLNFDAPKLYTRIGKKLAELAHDLAPFGLHLTVAILTPKDDSRPGSKFTCTSNLLRECTALNPIKNTTAKLIETSHGGIGLNTFIAQI